MKINGSCHCGGITYEAEIDPASAGVCHCTDCQTLSGSAFRTVVAAREQDYRLLTGTPKIYVKTAQSGTARQQVFCPDCGTQIYATSTGDQPKVLNLRLGTIKQRDQIRPVVQYWFRSAQGWVLDLASIEKHQQQ